MAGKRTKAKRSSPAAASSNKKRRAEETAVSSAATAATAQEENAAVVARHVPAMTASSSLLVHRCRFVEWMPEAIHALCFNPTNASELALARANGDVEIWRDVAVAHVPKAAAAAAASTASAPQSTESASAKLAPSAAGVNVKKSRSKWQLQYMIPGSEHAKISCMKWSQSNRLFVGSLDGMLWELDLMTLTKKNVVDSSGGIVWCMELHDAKELMAIGCEDGRIRLFSYANDQLFFRKGFVRTNSRVVSMAWHTNSNKLFSGTQDGIIHCWNSVTGRNESRITLETIRVKQQVSKCIVWCLLVLDDLTVVSGDSHGMLNFWNGHNGTLVQKSSHFTADILSLCTNEANSMLFASGVDNQVVQFQRTNSDNGSWAYCYSHRAHSHDVRALALSNNAVLVSGGIDTQLVWYDAQHFHVQRPCKAASSPNHPIFSISREKRLMLVQSGSRSLEVWQLAKTKAAADSSKSSLAKQKLLLEIQLKDHEANICCSSISPNGQFIGVSTSYEFKLFELEATISSSGDNLEIHPRKVQLHSSSPLAPVHLMTFSPDSTRLITISQGHFVQVLNLKTLEQLKTFDTSRVRTTWRRDSFVEADSKLEQVAQEDGAPITCVSVSCDGQWLVCATRANALLVYHLDALQCHGVLPTPHAKVTSMHFLAFSSQLVVTLVTNALLVFDVESRTVATTTSKSLEQQLVSMGGDGKPLKGMAVEGSSSRSSKVYLYSQSSLYPLDSKRQVDAQVEADPATDSVVDRATNTEQPSQEALAQSSPVISRYRPLTFVDFLGVNELVVVETPWLKVLSRLPGAVARHKYGQ